MFTFCKARWARGKNWKENQATKVTKIPKTKNQETKMWNEQNRNDPIIKNNSVSYRDIGGKKDARHTFLLLY